MALPFVKAEVSEDTVATTDPNVSDGSRTYMEGWPDATCVNAFGGSTLLERRKRTLPDLELRPGKRMRLQRRPPTPAVPSNMFNPSTTPSDEDCKEIPDDSGSFYSCDEDPELVHNPIPSARHNAGSPGAYVDRLKETRHRMEKHARELGHVIEALDSGSGDPNHEAEIQKDKVIEKFAVKVAPLIDILFHVIIRQVL